MSAQLHSDGIEGAVDGPWTVWLGQPECNNHALSGGKAAYLSVLAADFRVPEGFCLTTAAFEHARMAGFDADGSPTADWILPDALRHELARAYHGLAGRSGLAAPPVAVRSSAADEDGSAASLAGQHLTVLNVAGADLVGAAAVQCWRSARASRAQSYRRAHGLPMHDIGMAVLVQRLVQADVSAVAFSAHPLTGDRAQLVINASWGLGESIVGGTVTPDTYLVRKDSLDIVSCQIAEKRRMTVSMDAGTREVDVPRFLRLRPALAGEQVLEVARMVLALEARLGWPVDVECAYQAGALFLLQCRPITALPRR